jgi:hypothetical protein
MRLAGIPNFGTTRVAGITYCRVREGLKEESCICDKTIPLKFILGCVGHHRECSLSACARIRHGNIDDSCFSSFASSQRPVIQPVLLKFQVVMKK